MLVAKWVIADPIREMYWTGNHDPNNALFTAYPKKSKTYDTEALALTGLDTEAIRPGFYRVIKIYYRK